MIRQKLSFDSCFEVFLADTPESKEIHYRLRYQVYCDEMGFEDKERFPDRQETDEWDNDAVHFLVRHKYTGQWLGALRLVRHKDYGFPFQERCNLHEKLSRTGYKHAIEISRLCVLKEARRYKPRAYGVDEGSRNVSFLHDHRNLNRSIMWGLYRAAVVYSAQNDIAHWYILVTPALAYFVNKEGFEMRQIGDPCNHRGQRTPYRLSVNHILKNPLWQQDYRNDYRLYSELMDAFPARLGQRQLRQIGVISFVSRM